jgi:hypothetical protein
MQNGSSDKLTRFNVFLGRPLPPRGGFADRNFERLIATMPTRPMVVDLFSSPTPLAAAETRRTLKP